jgi:uncharacterized protein DUF2844
MIFRTCKCALILLIASLNPLGLAQAYAGLGGDSASVDADGADLHGTVSTENYPRYTVLEITAESGMCVREFLNENGSIFAVSWTGPVLPDLRHLMGAHFAQYAAALAALKHPGLQRSVRVAMADLIVESGGHLRAYVGRAYLPDLIPSGISVSDLH